MGASGPINSNPPKPDPTASEIKNLQAEVDFLTGQVRWLMLQVQRIEAVVQVTTDGLVVHAGSSKFSVLASSGVTLDSHRIELKTPQKDEVRV